MGQFSQCSIFWEWMHCVTLHWMKRPLMLMWSTDRCCFSNIKQYFDFSEPSASFYASFKDNKVFLMLGDVFYRLNSSNNKICIFLIRQIFLQLENLSWALQDSPCFSALPPSAAITVSTRSAITATCVHCFCPFILKERQDVRTEASFLSMLLCCILGP